MRDVLANSLDVVFAFDNKIWHSLVALIAFPGRLTKDYLDGKIVRYIHPSKLFWFLMIAFLALLVGATKTDGFKKEIENTAVEQQAQTGEPASVDGGGHIFEINGHPIVNIEEFVEKLLAWAPYMMMFFAPLFALLVWLFYWRRSYYYADYLIFALHFHAFVFLLYSIILGVELIFPDLVSDGIYRKVSVAIELAVPWVYMVMSLRRVFGAKIVPAIFKTAMMTFMYFLCMAIVSTSVMVAWGVVTGKININ